MSHFKVIVTWDKKVRVVELPRQGYSFQQLNNELTNKVRGCDFERFSLRWARTGGSQQIIREEDEFRAVVDEALNSRKKNVELQLSPIYGAQTTGNTGNTQPKKKKTTNTPTNSPNVNTSSQNRPNTTINIPSGNNANVNRANTPSTNTPSNTNVGRTTTSNSNDPSFITAFTLAANTRGPEKVEVDAKFEQSGNERLFVFTVTPAKSEVEVTVRLGEPNRIDYVLKHTTTAPNGATQILTVNKQFTLPSNVKTSQFTVDRQTVTLHLD